MSSADRLTDVPFVVPLGVPTDTYPVADFPDGALAMSTGTFVGLSADLATALAFLPGPRTVADLDADLGPLGWSVQRLVDAEAALVLGLGPEQDLDALTGWALHARCDYERHTADGRLHEVRRGAEIMLITWEAVNAMSYAQAGDSVVAALSSSQGEDQTPAQTLAGLYASLPALLGDGFAYLGVMEETDQLLAPLRQDTGELVLDIPALSAVLGEPAAAMRGLGYLYFHTACGDGRALTLHVDVRGRTATAFAGVDDAAPSASVSFTDVRAVFAVGDTVEVLVGDFLSLRVAPNGPVTLDVEAACPASGRPACHVERHGHDLGSDFGAS